MTDLSLTRTGSSANIDFYKANHDTVYAEVLINSFVKVDGGLRARKVPIYTITVYRHDGRRWTETTPKIKYEPQSRPTGAHLPDRTVTKLVREHLKES